MTSQIVMGTTIATAILTSAPREGSHTSWWPQYGQRIRPDWIEIPHSLQGIIVSVKLVPTLPPAAGIFEVPRERIFASWNPQ
jgi:hypothetical protein